VCTFAPQVLIDRPYRPTLALLTGLLPVYLLMFLWAL
jgi:hypothetical protein